jgi:hypothetical protein
MGQRGSWPIAEPSASTSASQSRRMAPSEVATPPVVQIRPSLGRTREKRAKRMALPSRAGATALTSDPVQ